MTGWEEQPPPYGMDESADVTASVTATSEADDPFRIVERLTNENQLLSQQVAHLERLVQALSDPSSPECQQVHQTVFAEAARFKENAETYCFELLRDSEQSEKARADARIAEVEKEMLALQQTHIAGQQELSRVTSVLNSMELAHEDETSRLRAINDRRRDTIKRLRGSLDDKKFQRKENRKKIMAENAELKSSLGNLQKDIKKLEKTNGEIQSQLASTQRWAERLEETESTLQAEVEELRRENVRLNCDVEDLQSDREDEYLMDDGQRDWQALRDQLHTQYCELAAVANIINLHVKDTTVLEALSNAVKSVQNVKLSDRKRAKRKPVLSTSKSDADSEMGDYEGQPKRSKT
ncbi:hypothetical protein B0I72DRAFT_13474 [Yarrowia lipolytica]|uniref:YALI0E10593p n=2 Tax=Yarrowia lipolytica TaxID=4952 RepID=Q6C6C5_YARLI|nr:YALI0E10593p [Yarrowia lipolytica CLIB122]RDW25250.1 hypothetical protein B0I71DRAFT_42364 [Yarrowia lipolytica]RDW34570.1 hypothetical protein B0I72DRAFT_13474 [Yarrowia lipolytica]RDW38874.1 hypothetical protein B0I73DRAFT_40087 [Yarrowia lipolytica]RDW49305.1 hypothetical protein B0I74DRAFT_17394 [Yarrowia lipolytica]RDW55893.1 hypothetical protein B0I75DRAFT_23978 [Yarrowia lipolytica]|eukprot:XP_503787.1 YALI0E10593p [Yarrowia lipolytica CLIB122]